MSKNLKLKKVIKSFVPEQKKKKKRVVSVSRIFRDSYAWVYLVRIFRPVYVTIDWFGFFVLMAYQPL